ncbi:hypothetical protein ISS06_01250 [Patescibacteria group bacterium]|nr:hypothetical protein [Patescibacteria group bacterium]
MPASNPVRQLKPSLIFGALNKDLRAILKDTKDMVACLDIFSNKLAREYKITIIKINGQAPYVHTYKKDKQNKRKYLFLRIAKIPIIKIMIERAGALVKDRRYKNHDIKNPILVQKNGIFAFIFFKNQKINKKQRAPKKAVASFVLIKGSISIASGSRLLGEGMLMKGTSNRW